MSAFAAFSFAVSLTLCTEVIAEHGAEDKVFLRRQLVEWTSDNEADSVETFLATNIEVQVILARRLQYIVHILTAKAFLCTVFILLGACEQHHLSDSFLQFVDMVGKHL